MLQLTTHYAMTTPATQVKQTYTLVVGLGATGLSVVKYLCALGEQVRVVDSREQPPQLPRLQQEYPDVEVHCGAFVENDFCHAHRIVLSPGVPLTTPALQRAKAQGVEITGDIDLFAHQVSVPVIGITGSNGKSTVTALVYDMALGSGRRVAMGGNFGTPALDLIDETNQLYVLELSSFQLDTMRELTLHAGVVLNISDDHMDRYADFSSYAASKHVLYQLAERWVINRDDALAARPPFAAPNTVLDFSLDAHTTALYAVRDIDGAAWLCRGDEALLAVADMRIKGRHNVANALAALALGELAGLERLAMLESLRKFDGLAHRTQWIAEINSVNWYDDSKATNVGAALAAICGLAGRHVLIAGGEGKDADFSPLRTAISHLRAVVLIGRDATIIADALAGSVQCVFATDMHDAVLQCAALAQRGDNVLLSPACASFDMFDNYAHRGEVFAREVRGLL
jgi:UDP-N-acetylmuramoylalanine--D-glutamate ligase